MIKIFVYKRILLIFMLTISGLTLATYVNASTVMFTYGYSVDSTTWPGMGANPATSPPWLTATFGDTGTTGHVQLTLTASNLATNPTREFVHDLYFNVAGDKNVSLASANLNDVSYPGGQGLFSSNNQRADGIRPDFDVWIALAAPLYQGQSITLILLGDITADSFNVLNGPNTGTTGMVFTAAHVQGITGGEGSAWVTGTPPTTHAPIPPTLYLLGAGLLGLVGLRRKSSRHRSLN